jgi:peroxin-2
MPGQDFWQQAWDQAQPQIEAIRSSLGTGTTPLVSQSVQGHVKGHALRIGQLDAELLDHELLQLLKEPVSKPLRLISVCIRELEGYY